MMREISEGISMGFRECEYQFKHHRWNCTSIARSMRKILLKGERLEFVVILDSVCVEMTTAMIVIFRENLIFKLTIANFTLRSNGARRNAVHSHFPSVTSAEAFSHFGMPITNGRIRAYDKSTAKKELTA